MFVRKFEADTIEEALKDIKRELGPDAVILKTITNKGLKGAFKKKKIEITAAISEKNYVKKASVDSILDTNQQEEFYSGSASYIANMIDQHDQAQEKKNVQSNKHANTPRNNGGYGLAGLNKQVNSTKTIASQIKEGLDDFLSLGEKEDRVLNSFDEYDYEEEIELPAPKNQRQAARPQAQQQRPAPQQERYVEPQKARPTQQTRVQAEPVQEYQAPQQSHAQTRAEPVQNFQQSARNVIAEEMIEKQKNKIEELEKKLYELSKSFERVHKKEPIGIYQLRTTLRSLDINDVYIQQLIKKGLFELTDTDVENSDVVFEFALREMMNSIQTSTPLYSRPELKKMPTITVFLSELSCGQTSMVQKIGAAKKDAVIIKNAAMSIHQKAQVVATRPFAEKMFGLNVVNTSTIAEMVSECRRALESGKSVFIDYKCTDAEVNETKKFIDGLRRAFSNVEVLITLSAIHSELYNRKVISSYRNLSDGLVVSHVDACLNFGALFNINYDIKELPYKFFGTGEVCPDDLEAATAERLMAGIFKLS